MAKRSKNQYRREKQKLRKLAPENGNDGKEGKEIRDEKGSKSGNDGNEYRNERTTDKSLETAESESIDGGTVKSDDGKSTEKSRGDRDDQNDTKPDATDILSDENVHGLQTSAKDGLAELFSKLKDTTSAEETADAAVAPDLQAQYQHIFQKFENRPVMAVKRASEPVSESDSDSGSEPEPPKARKQKVSIAELKTSTSRPQLVEWYDADAPDPLLVVYLKTRLNHVDVPSHWQAKKDYLLAKRGSEKPPYRLPKYIASTGISEMRNHDVELLKKLQRDRVQPKMGKLDIDYQRLHDAFFKHQTRPETLGFGDVFAEGRDEGDTYGDFRPGKTSVLLRNAVGFGEGPPPWISLMHELGKPPSYKNLLIPGLDITYLNTGYKVQFPEGTAPLDFMGETWGKMEEGEESEESEEESEPENEADEKDVEKEDAAEDADENDKEDNAEISEEPPKVDITEFSRYKSAGTTTTSSSGTLYTVLKESGKAYELEKSEPAQEPVQKPVPAKEETFKF